MAPLSVERDDIRIEENKGDFLKDKEKFETPAKAHEVLPVEATILTYYHLASLYGIYLGFTSAKWATIGFGILLYWLGILGITAGVHRLWSHKSYKAKLPLQIILMIFQSIAFQKSAINWITNHRLHHKFSDTDGDPHNAKRGLFFSHMGWLITKQSKEVIEGKKGLNMSDIYSNPVLSFQKRHAVLILMTCCFVLPTAIPMYFWNETLNNSYHLNMLRFIVCLHVTCSVNSVAHKWGYKPYDKNILAGENTILSLASLGEGFHNYHHSFPWDYKTAELGNMKYNLTTYFINFFAWIGWAYDLKTATDEVVQSRAARTGDGTELVGAKETNSQR